jgi:hypothetical protein
MAINGPSSSLGGRVTFLAQAHDEAWCAGAHSSAPGSMRHLSISDCFRVMNSKCFYLFSVLSIYYSSN